MNTEVIARLLEEMRDISGRIRRSGAAIVLATKLDTLINQLAEAVGAGTTKPLDKKERRV